MSLWWRNRAERLFLMKTTPCPCSMGSVEPSATVAPASSLPTNTGHILLPGKLLFTLQGSARCPFRAACFLIQAELSLLSLCLTDISLHWHISCTITSLIRDGASWCLICLCISYFPHLNLSLSTPSATTCWVGDREISFTSPFFSNSSAVAQTPFIVPVPPRLSASVLTISNESRGQWWVPGCSRKLVKDTATIKIRVILWWLGGKQTFQDRGPAVSFAFFLPSPFLSLPGTVPAGSWLRSENSSYQEVGKGAPDG